MKFLNEKVDIKENSILNYDEELLRLLLIDKTTKKNIIWGTDIYKKYGKGYDVKDKITVEKITGIYGDVIKPRIKKLKEEKVYRTREKGEVFTPSYICNIQNNFIDFDLLKYDNAFNFENDNKWTINDKKISFDKVESIEKFTWQDYVLLNKMEITCGEAPYIVSRYDTVTGDIIGLKNRIGMLDRKIRVINENVKDDNEWKEWVIKAYEHIYGYEWQGDSLLIARENLLYTYADYYYDRFNKNPTIDELQVICEKIVWNIWQMDGLKCVIPMSCKIENHNENNLLDYINMLNGNVNKVKNKKVECKGCKEGDFVISIKKHNGIYCKIMDWGKNKIIKFVDLM